MIEVSVLFKYKTGEVKEETRKFDNRYSALRFMYGIEHNYHIVTGWKCDNPKDNEYLSKRFRLKPPFIRKG